MPIRDFLTRTFLTKKHDTGMHGLGLLCVGAMLAVSTPTALSAPLAGLTTARDKTAQSRAGQDPVELTVKAAALVNKAHGLEASARLKEVAGCGNEASDAFTNASKLYQSAGVAYAAASGDWRRAGKIEMADALRPKYEAAFDASSRDFKLSEAAFDREIEVIANGGTPPDASNLVPAGRTSPPVPAPAMNPAPQPTSAAPKSGVFSGRCLRADGQPVANVLVGIGGVSDAGQNVALETHSDASGRYSVHMPPGSYHILDALSQVTLGDTTYNLPLGIAGGGSNDATDIAPGVVRDLTLHIQGRISPDDDAAKGASYYGGEVLLAAQPSSDMSLNGFPDGSTVELTLTPVGALADGSAGRTLTLTQKPKPTFSSVDFLDIPIGKYTASARLVGSDGTATPLQIAWRTFSSIPSDGDYAATADTQFPPALIKFSSPGQSSGVDMAYAYVK